MILYLTILAISIPPSYTPSLITVAIVHQLAPRVQDTIQPIQIIINLIHCRQRSIPPRTQFLVFWGGHDSVLAEPLVAELEEVC